MGIIQKKPTTSTQRFTTVSSFDELTTDRPYKPLTRPAKRRGGRNVYGRITAYHRGGGHKRRIRIIDFKRDKPDVPAIVVSTEYPFSI